MALRDAVVSVGMYLLVSDTVVVRDCSFLVSVTFDPPSGKGVGEEVAMSRVLSGVLRASSMSSCAFVMDRWVPYM